MNFAVNEYYHIGAFHTIDHPLFYLKVVPGKPMGILTWPGKDCSLPSLMLYCHTDVVPVFPVSKPALSLNMKVLFASLCFTNPHLEEMY